MNSLFRDVKASTKAVFAHVSTAVTAAGTGDATEITGATIDKNTLGFHAESVVFETPVRAVLAATKTITITMNIEDSADGNSWADVSTAAVELTLLGGSGGTTETGVARHGYDLNKLRRYIRVMVTPDMSNTATDTAVVGGGVATFAGIQQLP